MSGAEICRRKEEVGIEENQAFQTQELSICKGESTEVLTEDFERNTALFFSRKKSDDEVSK